MLYFSCGYKTHSTLGNPNFETRSDSRGAVLRGADFGAGAVHGAPVLRDLAGQLGGGGGPRGAAPAPQGAAAGATSGARARGSEEGGSPARGEF